jgi:hypothetical protein
VAFYGIVHTPQAFADKHPGEHDKPNPLNADDDTGDKRTRSNLDITGTVYYKDGTTANIDTSGGDQTITLHPGEHFRVSFNYDVINTIGGTWDSDIYFIGGGGSNCTYVDCVSHPSSDDGGSVELNDDTVGQNQDTDPGTLDGSDGTNDGDGYPSGPSCPSYNFNHDSPFASDGNPDATRTPPDY